MSFLQYEQWYFQYFAAAAGASFIFFIVWICVGEDLLPNNYQLALGILVASVVSFIVCGIIACRGEGSTV